VARATFRSPLFPFSAGTPRNFLVHAKCVIFVLFLSLRRGSGSTSTETVELQCGRVLPPAIQVEVGGKSSSKLLPLPSFRGAFQTCPKPDDALFHQPPAGAPPPFFHLLGLKPRGVAFILFSCSGLTFPSRADAFSFFFAIPFAPLPPWNFA